MRAFSSERVAWLVVCTSTLEANDSQEDLVVSRAKLDKVFRSEGPHHTPVQQGLHHLGLQHSDFTAKCGGRPVIQLRAEPFEACPRETGDAVDFEREVSAFFVDNDA